MSEMSEIIEISDVELARKFVKKHDRALKAGIEFSLTFGEYKRITKRKMCAYSGIPFSPINFDKGWKYPWRGLTLDRIDNKKGYISGNVVPVCHGINQLKSQWEDPNLTLTEEITIKVIKKIALMKKNLTK